MSYSLTDDFDEPVDNDLSSKSEITVRRFNNGKISTVTDVLALEIAVALVYNGISHAVMMASPNNLYDFALGFSLTEGIIESPIELKEFEKVNLDDGIELRLTITARRIMALKESRRSLVGITGCGLCGKESLDKAMTPIKNIEKNKHSKELAIGDIAIQHAVLNLNKNQPLQNKTGSYHGAAWCDENGNIVLVREDVGRHNALDKLIGAIKRLEIDTSNGFALVSSRASYEMVQKVAVSAINTLVSVSAPTSLALQVAKTANVELIGFARPNRHVHYHQIKT